MGEDGVEVLRLLVRVRAWARDRARGRGRVRARARLRTRVRGSPPRQAAPCTAKHALRGESRPG